VAPADSLPWRADAQAPVRPTTAAYSNRWDGGLSIEQSGVFVENRTLDIELALDRLQPGGVNVSISLQVTNVAGASATNEYVVLVWRPFPVFPYPPNCCRFAMQGDVERHQLASLQLPAVGQVCKRQRFEQSTLNPTTPIVDVAEGKVPSVKGACRVVGTDVWSSSEGQWLSVADLWRRNSNYDDSPRDADGDDNDGYGWKWGWKKDGGSCASGNGNIPQGFEHEDSPFFLDDEWKLHLTTRFKGRTFLEESLLHNLVRVRFHCVAKANTPALDGCVSFVAEDLPVEEDGLRSSFVLLPDNGFCANPQAANQRLQIQTTQVPTAVTVVVPVNGVMPEAPAAGAQAALAAALQPPACAPTQVTTRTLSSNTDPLQLVNNYTLCDGLQPNLWASMLQYQLADAAAQSNSRQRFPADSVYSWQGDVPTSVDGGIDAVELLLFLRFPPSLLLLIDTQPLWLPLQLLTELSSALQVPSSRFEVHSVSSDSHAVNGAASRRLLVVSESEEGESAMVPLFLLPASGTESAKQPSVAAMQQALMAQAGDTQSALLQSRPGSLLAVALTGVEPRNRAVSTVLCADGFRRVSCASTLDSASVDPPSSREAPSPSSSLFVPLLGLVLLLVTGVLVLACLFVRRIRQLQKEGSVHPVTAITVTTSRSNSSKGHSECTLTASVRNEQDRQLRASFPGNVESPRGQQHNSDAHVMTAALECTSEQTGPMAVATMH
jgi:hypothetical protein